VSDETDKEACPRCGRARAAGEKACARCGLMVARWRSFRPDADDPPEMEPLWQELLAHWSDEAAHDRALEATINLAALPALARRYRLRLAADEEARRRGTAAPGRAIGGGSEPSQGSEDEARRRGTAAPGRAIAGGSEPSQGSEDDRIARARLQRLAVLAETGARAQAEEKVSMTAAYRLVWYMGYAVGIAGVAAAAWALYRVATQR
jgi:hypothetical protein